MVIMAPIERDGSLACQAELKQLRMAVEKEIFGSALKFVEIHQVGRIQLEGVWERSLFHGSESPHQGRWSMGLLCMLCLWARTPCYTLKCPKTEHKC